MSPASNTVLAVSRKTLSQFLCHDDVIKWKHFPHYWPFVRGIHRSPVNSPHKGQWRGALMFTLICARINGWVNNCEAGDLRRNRAHYDVIVMQSPNSRQFACLYGCGRGLSVGLKTTENPTSPEGPWYIANCQEFRRGEVFLKLYLY